MYDQVILRFSTAVTVISGAFQQKEAKITEVIQELQSETTGRKQ
jgi:transcription antitermination factor NusG